MQTYKTIVQGRLEFGSQRNYDQIHKMFLQRLENYYKNDSVLNAEEIFNEEELLVEIPRTVVHAADKTWKNTASILEHLAQFAIAGRVDFWVLKEGTLIAEYNIEPTADKTAVQSYLRGRSLFETKGQELEAIEALDKAISKYEKHAQAYEIRGFINIKLKNETDALRDFSKSISLNPNASDPYYGKALIKSKNGEFDAAVNNLEFAVKKSIPLQSVHWNARRLRAKCLMEQKDFEGALMDLKFYANRSFKEDNVHFKHKRNAWFNYGVALLHTKQYEEAKKAFNNALQLENQISTISDAQIIYHSGLASKLAGDFDFEYLFEEAEKLGFNAEKSKTQIPVFS